MPSCCRTDKHLRIQIETLTALLAEEQTHAEETQQRLETRVRDLEEAFQKAETELDMTNDELGCAYETIGKQTRKVVKGEALIRRLQALCTHQHKQILALQSQLDESTSRENALREEHMDLREFMTQSDNTDDESESGDDDDDADSCTQDASTTDYTAQDDTTMTTAVEDTTVDDEACKEVVLDGAMSSSSSTHSDADCDSGTE